MAALLSRSLRLPTLAVRTTLSKTTTTFQSPMTTSDFKPVLVSSQKIFRPQASGLVLGRRFFATENDEDDADVDAEEADGDDAVVGENDWMNRRSADPKDRSRVIPLEVSLAYMESAAYKAAYGDKKIWELYRRNFKKGKTFVPTRKTCIRHGKISCGNPCPICRDEYLVIDFRNLKLLNQFLSDYNGELLSSKRTGVCQIQYSKLLLEIERAKDRGLLKVDPPFVEYDYQYYMPKLC